MRFCRFQKEAEDQDAARGDADLVEGWVILQSEKCSIFPIQKGQKWRKDHRGLDWILFG